MKGKERRSHHGGNHSEHAEKAYPQLLLKMTHRLYASKSEDLDTHRLARPSRQRRARCMEEKKVDTEAGMLSGISRKRSMRSSTCWFTEFCNSQCLSHFAAPFIVVRAETSVAESCNKLQWQCQGSQKEATDTFKRRD